MEDKFNPKSLSINQLFCDADAFYQVPIYQRPYKWEDEHIDKLWDDIYTSFLNDDTNYFLGSIITAKPLSTVSYMDLVDGQQRITTLMILFCVIRDLYPKINNHTDDDPTNIDIDTIKDAIQQKGKVKRLKLHTHDQHHTDFQNTIIDGNTTGFTKPSKPDVRKDEEPIYKFENTAFLFTEKCKDIGEKKCGEFINYLFNKVKIIRIDCSTTEFAIKLFQVLNDRGLDLTAADLVKSYLLEKIQKEFNSDPDILKKKEGAFVSDWREIEQYAKDSYDNLNNILTMYEYYLLAQNPRKSLFEELQIDFKMKKPLDVISDFKAFVKAYKKEIYDVTNDKILFSFWYLPWTVYWRSILTTAIHRKYKDLKKLKKVLRRFYFLYWVAGRTLSAVKQTSFNVIKWLKENKDITEIEKEINNKIKEDDIVNSALNNLSKDISFYSWCKPLLALLEYNSADDSKISFIELNRDVHLEHILPHEYKKFPEWDYIKDDIALKWMEKPGNLTLLSGSKNIEASNNPFKTKIKVYKGKGKYDDKNQKITAFNITQNIVKDFEDKKYSGKWIEESMKDRHNWFCNEVGEILEINTKALKIK